ncbi:MAG: methionyl-tRNA formyltransferase [Roseiflexaceae bacterium]
MRILFLGTPEIAAIALEIIVQSPIVELVGIVTQPDRPAGRGRSLQPPPVKQRALDLGLDLPIIQPESLRDPAVIDQVRDLAPDLGIVAAYGEILRRNVLQLPKLGHLNIHPSLLPRHRGPAPVTGAILAGDDQVGVTVMQLSARMDAGPILAQHREPLAADARAGDLTRHLFAKGAKLLLACLPAYAAGQLVPQAQDEAAATYTSLIQKQDGVIDWSHSAEQIERMIRAYDPWPGTTTSLNGQTIRILSARVQPKPLAQRHPGSLMEQDGQLLVATGQGSLELLSLQPAGKRPMNAKEWRHGQRDLAALRFGE